VNINNLFNWITNKSQGPSKQPNQKDVVFNYVREQQKQRSTQDIRNWKQAMAAAESVLFPNRLQLYTMYRNIEIDAHLTSVVNTRMIKVLSKSFRIVNANGTEQKEKTAVFKAAWFEDFLRYAWESRMYGYSLIQLTGIKDGTIEGVKLVPRENVRPKEKLVVASPGMSDGIDYSTNDWVVGIGGDTDLGIYAKVAPLVLYKQNTMAAQAQFVDLYGIPYRLGKTNMADDKRANGLYQMLADMTSSGYGVMDKDDEMEFMDSSSSKGEAFAVFLDYLDKQISKLVLGGTMMSDDGSSRSQSEVHERTTDDYSEYDAKFLQYAINDHLLPALTVLGIQMDGYTFEFYAEEDKELLFEMTTTLLQSGLQVDTKWIEDKFKIPVSPAPTPTEAPADKKGNFQTPA
jgi:phage gp29-like protein